MNARSIFNRIGFGFVCALLASGGNVRAADAFAELNPARIAQIETLLPQRPAGFGRPASDRAFWTNATTRAIAGDAVADAEKMLGQTFPAWNDELYLEFSRIGRRPPGEKMLRDRHGWLKPLVVGECLENQGRFLPHINRVLRDYANEPSWTLPAHDRSLENFHRTKYSVDLASSAFGAELAQALYLLGDKIDPAVRRQVKEAIEQRLFAPFRKTLETGAGHGWLGKINSPVQNNWNAVCLAGVVGAARTLLPDRHERAVFVAAGEHYCAYFINGFRDDGYCDEGAGYWAYGFGNYVILREVVADATRGQIDLFANPKIKNIAAYGERIQMSEHTAPPFADCRFGTKADAGLVVYCRRVLKTGGGGSAQMPSVCKDKLAVQFMTVTPCVARPAADKAADEAAGLRSFFADAGVLVCRPKSNSNISAAIKADGNSSHSHNDIGSFVVAVGGEILVGDPGGPHAYNNKTFGPERYTYKILNSFGHPVPVVAGKLQRDATQVHPKVLATNFTAAQDEIEIDLQPAYDVPELKRLVRTMTFSRAGAGAVTIRDAVSFATPQTFEVAIQTLGSFRRVDERTIEIEFAGKKLRAEVQTPDGFELVEERIEELSAPAFTRIGIKLKKPILNGEVVVAFRPVSD